MSTSPAMPGKPPRWNCIARTVHVDQGGLKAGRGGWSADRPCWDIAANHSGYCVRLAAILVIASRPVRRNRSLAFTPVELNTSVHHSLIHASKKNSARKLGPMIEIFQIPAPARSAPGFRDDPRDRDKSARPSSAAELFVRPRQVIRPRPARPRGEGILNISWVNVGSS